MKMLRKVFIPVKYFNFQSFRGIQQSTKQFQLPNEAVYAQKEQNYDVIRLIFIYFFFTVNMKFCRWKKFE